MFGPEEQQAPQQQVLEPVRDSSGSLIPVAEPVIADNTGISSLPVISVDPVKEADRLRTTAILQGKMPPVMESEQMLQDAPPGMYTISALRDGSSIDSDKPVSEMSVSELESKQISSSKPIGTFFNNMYNSIKKSDAGFTSSIMGALGTTASAVGAENAGAYLFDLQKEFDSLKTKTDSKAQKRKLEIEDSVKKVTDELDRRNLDP